MSRLCCLLCVLLVLCAGCSNTQQPSQTDGTSSQESEAVQIPQELIGVWVSADPGELDMVETITFAEDGAISVNLRYQGEDYSTIGGSYSVEGHTIVCHMTEGTSPFTTEYEYVIDGRMLSLIDAEGTADYLRTS